VRLPSLRESRLDDNGYPIGVQTVSVNCCRTEIGLPRDDLLDGRYSAEEPMVCATLWLEGTGSTPWPESAGLPPQDTKEDMSMRRRAARNSTGSQLLTFAASPTVLPKRSDSKIELGCGIAAFCSKK
jgi:hypothetical protein